MSYQTEQLSKDLHTAIVLPYLNEQETLGSTCSSLGFGTGTNSTPQGVTLILVDNGSTDNSAGVAENVRKASLEGSVLIGHERERGYVPPRRRGNIMAQMLLNSIRGSSQDVIVLQADADTYYGEGYVTAMRSATQTIGTNVLIEACTSYP